ncbi:MAG: BON domain-containing protein [Burkholderiaceae bacterium]
MPATTKSHATSRSALLICLALTILAPLSGCGLLVVGGTAATTAAVATDRRTAGQQVEDKSIELKEGSEMRKLFGDNARVNATSYGGVVLLTGDMPTAQDKQKAGQTAAKVEKVKRVVNELRVGDITPLSVRTNDSWITSKVRTSLINTQEVPSRTIAITTERGIVYLLGIVTDTEGQRAAKVASNISGVNKVVKLFQIVSPESLMQTQTPAPVENAASPAAAPAPAAPSGDIQTMPVK